MTTDQPTAAIRLASRLAKSTCIVATLALPAIAEQPQEAGGLAKDTEVASHADPNHAEPNPMSIRGELRERLLAAQPSVTLSNKQQIVADETPLPSVVLQALVLRDGRSGHAWIRINGAKRGFMLPLPAAQFSDNDSVSIAQPSQRAAVMISVNGRNLTLVRWSKSHIEFVTEDGSKVLAR